MIRFVFSFFLFLNIVLCPCLKAEDAAVDVVALFGKEMNEWCITGSILKREKVESLCDGLKKCRVEDRIHTDYQLSQGLTNYETFVLDSYLNMFQSHLHDNIGFSISNIKVAEEDEMSEGQKLSFVTADVKVTGPVNREVTDLFLVRDGKISGIYSFDSQLGFSHLNGSLIRALELGRYVWATNSKNGFVQVTNEAGLEGLIDSKGNVIIPCVWDAIDFHGGDFARGFNIRRGNESATYDLRKDGKRVPIEGIVKTWLVGAYDEVTTFRNGYAVVYDPDTDKYGFLLQYDPSYIVHYIYDRASNFAEGYAAVGAFGATFLIDKTFTKHVNPNAERYRIPDHPYEGLAKIQDKSTGKWGFMDTKGKIVIPCKFDRVGLGFSNGICAVERFDQPSKSPYYQTSKSALINKKGDLLTEYIFDWTGEIFEDGYIKAAKGIDGRRKESLVEATGEPLPGFNWDYDTIREFHDGLAIFEKDKKFGFLNRDGSVAIPALYDLAFFFKEGIACVKKNVNGESKYGGINKKGVEVIPFIYDEKFFFENGVALVVKDNQVGLIDAFGNSTFLTKAK